MWAPGIHWWLSGKQSACRCRRHDPWLMPRSNWVPAPQGWACVLEPGSHNDWRPACPRARALQQGKPPQWEAQAPQPEKSPHSNEDPAQSKKTINKWINEISWRLYLEQPPLPCTTKSKWGHPLIILHNFFIALNILRVEYVYSLLIV